MVLGHTGSGKTTAAKMIAKFLRSNPPRNCSDFIIEDYAAKKDLNPKEILKHKDNYRQDLFKYGLYRQDTDPAYPISEAIKHTNVVTGARTPENLAAARSLFDLVIWVDRIAAKSGSTDKLGPKDADRVIDNNSTFKELEENIKKALVIEMTKSFRERRNI